MSSAPHPGTHQKSNKAEGIYENENYLNYAIIVGVFLVLMSVVVRYLAIFAIYVYAPLLYPVWVMGYKYGTFASSSLIFVYAGVCLGIAAYYFMKKGSIKYFWLVWGVVWILAGVFEIVIGAKDSMLTGYMNVYCAPTPKHYWSAIFNCRNTVESLMSMPIFLVVGYSILPNIVLFATPMLTDLVGGFFRLSKEHPKALSTQVHNIDSLIKSQKVMYPHLKIYDVLNPNDYPIFKGQLRLLDSSRRFVFDRRMVTGFVARASVASENAYMPDSPLGQNDMERMEDLDINTSDRIPVIDPDKFTKEITHQLGAIWTGSQDLTATETILLSIALPRACVVSESISLELAKEVNDDCFRRIDEVNEWVAINIENKVKVLDLEKRGKRISEKLWKLASRDINDFPKLEEYREAIDAWLEEPIAQEIFNNHAYNRTIIFRALEEAKKLGVMQPSSFRWLKFYDREMWALVENVNRPSGFVENIGAYSHYKAERRTGKAIYKPMIQAAYNGLMERIGEFKYTEKVISTWEEYISTTDEDKKSELEQKLLDMNLFTDDKKPYWF